MNPARFVAGLIPSTFFRRLTLYAIDLAVSGFAFAIAVLLRHDLDFASLASSENVVATLLFVAICAVTFPMVGLYNKHWRYASLKDLVVIAIAVVLSSLLFLGATSLTSGFTNFAPTVGIEVFVLVCVLGAVRLAFRLDEIIRPELRSGARSADKNIVPILLVGAGSAADFYLRALHRERDTTYKPVGVLDSDPRNRGLMLRGVPVLGTLNDFERIAGVLEASGRRPRHVVFTDELAHFGESASELIESAGRLGIAVSRLRAPTELRSPTTQDRYELRPIELSDLLERSQAALDRAALERLVFGRKILVSGAGGSIGKELVLQIAALRPAELVLLDSCECNLYEVELELKEKMQDGGLTCYLCNIREPKRVNEIFDQHSPEIVFHAAALKHVPLVELNPCEGVLTNVMGTMHVAAAAKRIGASAMVQISTDKVVNPTSVMGATKRLAELYCQALDVESNKGSTGPRFMTVRFGNVLGSSGSLIPLFQRQLARGGPLTVTHEEMRRFFMTIREAVELTLQASAYGLEKSLGRGQIFVLDMGEPIRIVDIARRMIRLAGFEPDKEIKIEIVGLRPGEKLYEELFDGSSEVVVESPVPGVLGAMQSPIALSELDAGFSKLRSCAETGDVSGLLQVMSELLPGYKPADRPLVGRAQGASAGGGVADSVAA